MMLESWCLFHWRMTFEVAVDDYRGDVHILFPAACLLPSLLQQKRQVIIWKPHAWLRFFVTCWRRKWILLLRHVTCPICMSQKIEHVILILTCCKKIGNVICHNWHVTKKWTSHKNGCFVTFCFWKWTVSELPVYRNHVLNSIPIYYLRHLV